MADAGYTYYGYATNPHSRLTTTHYSLLTTHYAPWQFLLATNSVVLKQHSYYWEYYYAALQPHAHYLPFWDESAHDILTVLPNVTAPQHDAAMRKVRSKCVVSSAALRLDLLLLILTTACPIYYRWAVAAQPSPSVTSTHTRGRCVGS